MSAASLPLSQLLAARRIDGTTVEFPVTEDWLQGRTTFGGLQAVMAVLAMRDVAGAAWPAAVELKSLQTNFVGPIGAGQVQIDVQLLREGKNVRQVKATARQAGEVAAVFFGVFASARESALPQLMPSAQPLPRRPDEIADAPYLAGLMPAFLQHLQMRWADGAPPYSGGSTWHASQYLRLRDEAGAAALPWANELLTVFMADVAPTPALGRVSGPAPASSVSWALELRTPAAAQPEDGWWRLDKDTAAAAHGYVNERATLWAPDGSLAAFGYQVVTVYA